MISSIILVAYQCTYDRSLIYYQNYTIGENDSLKINGYYSSKSSITTTEGRKEFMYPIFFYEDGSVIYMGAFKDSLELRKRIIDNSKSVWGYWGNYIINNDSIFIETIGSYGGSFHHERRTQIGLIKNDSILFFQNVDRKGNIEEINDTICFSKFDLKPDSSSNWIRNKKRLDKRRKYR